MRCRLIVGPIGRRLHGNPNSDDDEEDEAAYSSSPILIGRIIYSAMGRWFWQSLFRRESSGNSGDPSTRSAYVCMLACSLLLKQYFFVNFPIRPVCNMASNARVGAAARRGGPRGNILKIWKRNSAPLTYYAASDASTLSPNSFRTQPTHPPTGTDSRKRSAGTIAPPKFAPRRV